MKYIISLFIFFIILNFAMWYKNSSSFFDDLLTEKKYRLDVAKIKNATVYEKEKFIANRWDMFFAILLGIAVLLFIYDVITFYTVSKNTSGEQQ